MKKIVFLLLALFVLPSNAVIGAEMQADSGMKEEVVKMDSMDAKDANAKTMKMDEKKHARAIKKARAKYEAAVKKAQNDFVKNLKSMGKQKARSVLDKAKKAALATYTADKKKAMKETGER